MSKYKQRKTVKQLKKLAAHFEEFKCFTLQRFASTETILETMIEDAMQGRRKNDTRRD